MFVKPCLENMIMFKIKLWWYKASVYYTFVHVNYINKFNTTNPTSLSSHFLTIMSSPVMSLIVYIMFVADSCASRITPTIATCKGNTARIKSQDTLIQDKYSDPCFQDRTSIKQPNQLSYNSLLSVRCKISLCVMRRMGVESFRMGCTVQRKGGEGKQDGLSWLCSHCLH